MATRTNRNSRTRAPRSRNPIPKVVGFAKQHPLTTGLAAGAVAGGVGAYVLLRRNGKARKLANVVRDAKVVVRDVKGVSQAVSGNGPAARDRAPAANRRRATRSTRARRPSNRSR
jgi:hypothetical protein